MTPTHRETLTPFSLPSDNDTQAYLRAQFERGGVDAEGNMRMAKIAEYADRVQTTSRALMAAHGDAAGEERARVVDALAKEEISRELFANGSVDPAALRTRVAHRFHAVTGLPFNARTDGPSFTKAFRVIRTYALDRGRGLQNGTGLPRPRAR